MYIHPNWCRNIIARIHQDWVCFLGVSIVAFVLSIEVDPDGPDAVWGCDYVLVTYRDETKEFPVYDWITQSIEAASGEGTITNISVK